MSPEARIRPDGLTPYASFLVMYCDAENPVVAIRGQLLTFIRQRLETFRKGSATILAAGIEGMGGANDGTVGGLDAGVDQTEGFIYRRETTPPWTGYDSPYTDINHELLVLFRRGALVAVHAEAALRESIWTWLHRDPLPPFRLVPQAILQGAFVRGATRGLWLIGTHPRRTTKADSKNLTGPNLGEALNPFDDATFALGSAKSRLPADDHLPALGRDAGTTPRRGTVWLRATDSFDDFRSVAADMMQLIEETIASGGVDRPFPLLTTEVADLTGVVGAYEISTPGPDDLPGDPDVTQDALDAAVLLEGALLSVQGEPNTADFVISVGLNGVIAGQLRCSVSTERRRVRLALGFAGTPGNELVTRRILDALEHNKDLLSIYYVSGHCVRGGSIFRPEIRTVPFPRWEFREFAPFNILQEKPAGAHGAIHSQVGTPEDQSLFGWVVGSYPTGWLTCDDGPGEVADFVHLDDASGKLTLIHVKACTNDADGRSISASAYEVVTSQASKNLGFLNPGNLQARLENAAGTARATWKDGVREPDRSGFLAALASRSPIADVQVVIVQPHVRQGRYQQLRGEIGSSEDALRLARLETLLNTARGGLTGVGADLTVIGSI